MDGKKELINSYNELSIGDKRKELGREIAELTVVTQKLISDVIPSYQVKETEEFTNLFEENTSESDYLTGLYQDVIELEEAIGTYYNIATDIYYTDTNSNGGITNDKNKVYQKAGFGKIGILALLATVFSIGIIVLGLFLSR